MHDNEIRTAICSVGWLAITNFNLQDRKILIFLNFATKIWLDFFPLIDFYSTVAIGVEEALNKYELT